NDIFRCLRYPAELNSTTRPVKSTRGTKVPRNPTKQRRQNGYTSCPPWQRLFLRQALPGIHHSIGIQRNRPNALIAQPLSQIGVIAGALTANAHILARLQTRLDGTRQHELHSWITL